MTDEIIIHEAIRLVDEGVSVTFPVKGYSMLPFIIGGRESVILQKPLTVRLGDGNIVGVEHCLLRDVKALATHVVDAKGRKHDLYAPWRQRASRLWWQMRPVRRYILAIYRRLL